MKIERCPFCGGEAIVVKTESCGRYIGCWDCGGRTEEFETDYAGSAHDKAIAAWNRRTQPENKPHGLITAWETPKSCPSCSEHLSLDWSFCPECGRVTDWADNPPLQAEEGSIMQKVNATTNADRIRSMDREHQIEAVAEALCDWAGVGGKEGSYIYDLTRCKSAFGVGTMSFDDFQEWEEDRCLEVAAEFVDWLRQPAETEGTE